jgi:hypothetical protein
MKFPRTLILVLLLAVSTALGFGWRIVHPYSAVDWSVHPAVVLQSDDWGLRAWMPDSATAVALFPLLDAWGYGASPYRLSTLESAADVDRLAEQLAAVQGGDGRPALLQANTIVAAPDYAAIEAGGFTDFLLRALDRELPGWERPGLLDAIQRARAAGVWCPEFHGLSHLNAEAWLGLLRAGDLETLAAFRHAVLVNDKILDDYEYDPAIPLDQRRVRLQQGLELFERLFGRRPRSVIAPDYRWDRSSEDLWSEEGIGIVQGWRVQTTSEKGIGRAMKQWRRLSRPMGAYDRGRDLLRLNRNVFFEPGESPGRDHEEIARESLRAVRHAWQRDRPAVVCTHRMNYARLNSRETEHSLRAMESFLGAIVEADPRVVFLSDHELRQLYREGVSQERIVPGEIRLRNYTGRRQTLRLQIPRGAELLGVVEALGGGAVETRIEDGGIRVTLEPGDFTAHLRNELLWSRPGSASGLAW